MTQQREVFIPRTSLTVTDNVVPFLSNAIAWAIFALCKYPDTQRALREDITSIPTDAPSFDEINALPYLDAVVRETLRLFAPVSHTVRVPVEDSIIPLGEGIKCRDGVVREEIL